MNTLAALLLSLTITQADAPPEAPQQPQTLATIDISAAGPSCRMWLGDVNGDGWVDIVMAQPDTGFNDAYFPHSVVALTAFDLKGNQLWQIGTPDMDNRSGSGSDIPCQIYDLDHDGDNEVLAVMNDEVHVYNGKTGELKWKFPVPEEHAHDCLVIADFAGDGHPSEIVVKDRYRQVWALDSTDGTVLWTFRGNVGHYPWPYDLDGDGRDELIAGYHVINHDGTERWKMDLEGHADAIWVADVDADPSNGMEVIVGGDGTYVYHADGEQLWAYEGTVESQNAFPGDFRPDLPGLEIGGLDRIDRTRGAGLDGLFLVDAHGNELYKEDRQVPGWSTIATVVHNLDGEGTDHFLAYRRGGDLKPGLYDGHMRRVVDLPIEGHYMWADLVGAGASQLVAYNDEGKAYVLALVPIDLDAVPPGETKPQPKRLYNWTRYWGSQTD